MEKNTLGRTGLKVSKLGLGLAHIGGFHENDFYMVANLVNKAIDLGINFFDTAAVYGNSERYLGQILKGNRGKVLIATKCGDWKENFDWSAKTLINQIETSLKRLQTDYIDLLQVHSCPSEILESTDIFGVLEKAKRSGKVKFIGYSGDNKAAKIATLSGVFDTLQTSFNVVDQTASSNLFPICKKLNIGVIIKRPLMNGAWDGSLDRVNTTSKFMSMHERVNILQKDGPIHGYQDSPHELALKFAASQKEVNVILTGTTKISHITQNTRIINNDSTLPKKTLLELKSRFEKHGTKWEQIT